MPTDAQRARRRALYRQNRKRVRSYQRAYRNRPDQRAKERARGVRWRKANVGRAHAQHRLWRERTKLEVLVHYSRDPPECACCGETEVDFLTLDHINNDGGAHRRSIYPKGRWGGWRYYVWLKMHGYPPEIKLEVRCFNCNMGRQRTGVCPHARRG